jgi:hypothetical protein
MVVVDSVVVSFSSVSAGVEFTWKQRAATTTSSRTAAHRLVIVVICCCCPCGRRQLFVSSFIHWHSHALAAAPLSSLVKVMMIPELDRTWTWTWTLLGCFGRRSNSANGSSHGGGIAL